MIPLPVYPWLQAQVNDPGVLVHAALVSQSSVPEVHSSISIMFKIEYYGKKYIRISGRKISERFGFLKEMCFTQLFLV